MAQGLGKLKIDSDLLNSDWIKTLSWDFPGVETVEQLEMAVTMPAFLTLPAATAMPDALRREVEAKYGPQQFHLSGQHDQSAHGRKGSGKFSSPKDFVENATRLDVQALYSPPGYKFILHSDGFQKKGNTLSIDGDIWTEEQLNLNKGGNIPVGHLQREFTASGAVYHELFTVRDDLQGEGFAAKMNKQAEEQYREMGFKEVFVGADIDIGRYAWARQGYDFDDRTADVKEWRAQNLAARYHNMVTARIERDWPKNQRLEGLIERDRLVGKMFPEGKTFHAWEVAAMDDGEQYVYRDRRNESHSGHLGKSLLINGSDWEGVKSLDPNSTSYKIGEAYYEQRLK